MVRKIPISWLNCKIRQPIIKTVSVYSIKFGKFRLGNEIKYIVDDDKFLSVSISYKYVCIQI